MAGHMGAEPIVPWSPGRRAEVSRVDTALWGVAARPEGLGEEGIWKALGPPLLSSGATHPPRLPVGGICSDDLGQQRRPLLLAGAWTQTLAWSAGALG